MNIWLPSSWLAIFFLVSSLHASRADVIQKLECSSEEFVRHAAAKNGFFTGDINWSAWNDFDKLDVNFDANRSMNKDKGRFYALYLSALVLNTYNNNRQLRPFLHVFPMDFSNITLTVSYGGFFEDKPDPYTAEWILVIHNHLVFFDQYGKRQGEESFQEAAEKVRQYEIANGLEDSSAYYQSIMHLKPLPKRKGEILKTPRLPPVATPR